MEIFGLRIQRGAAQFWALFSALGAVVFAALYFLNVSKETQAVWIGFGIVHWIGGLWVHAVLKDDIQIVRHDIWNRNNAQKAFIRLCGPGSLLAIIKAAATWFSSGKTTGFYACCFVAYVLAAWWTAYTLEQMYPSSEAEG